MLLEVFDMNRWIGEYDVRGLENLGEKDIFCNGILILCMKYAKVCTIVCI